MPKKRIHRHLDTEERSLEDLTKGKAAAYKVNHASYVIGGYQRSWGGWKDETISSFKYQCRHH